MIKICILTSVHSPFDIRIFHKEGKSLVKAGFDVTLIAPHDKNETVDGIRIVPLMKSKNRIHRMTKTALQVYWHARKIDADIYHFHDPELIPIGLLLKSRGKRIIYDVHEDVPRQSLSKPYIPAIFRKPVSRMTEALEIFSAHRFDGIVTATPFINRRFLKLRACAVNVNNYPLLSELCPTDDQWRGKEKVVCYVGGIARIRGALEMVEAIAKTKYRLLLAGNIEPDINIKIKQMLGWRQVEELGFVGRDGVKATAARSMAGLVLFHPEPNHVNAQPNKIFEYMSAGLPVIASNFPLWREIIEDNDCGLCVDPLDPKAIAGAIEYLLMNRDIACSMGQNGRKAVLSKYNWQIEEKKLYQFYAALG